MDEHDEQATSVGTTDAEDAAPLRGADAPAIGSQSLSAWIGREVVDANGVTIGRLEEVYFDIESDDPQFGVVLQGSLIHHRRFVPLANVVVGPDSIQVAVTEEDVRHAPSADKAGDQLTADDESALYHHFRLNYVATDRESGRRLVRH